MDGALPLGVCVFADPPPNAARVVSYGDVIHEVLDHAGLCRAVVEPERLAERLPTLRLLVTVGEAALDDVTREALRTWVTGGGAWLTIGGICGLADLLGVEEERPPIEAFGGGRVTLGEGYMRVDRPLHPDLAALRQPLHFFNGIAVHARGGQSVAGVCDAHRRPTRRAAVVEAAPGAGHTLLIAPDVTGTLVRIQQGVAVTRDGIPSPDGLATLNDGVLKSDDGAVLDWDFDRQHVPQAPGFRAFLHPVADQWRELLIRAILELATRVHLSVNALWYWPRNLPAVAHMSHDSDHNDPALARQMLEVLEEADVTSTWCIVLPGYDANVIAAIRTAGHELAMHFDAVSNGTAFTEEEFARQWWALRALLGEAPTTNKNHYLRWEGDTAFYDWCERCGITLDQSKGASKTGEAGFNFGTCHPFFPRRPDGSRVDVLELATPTQDLLVFAPPSLAAPLLDSVVRHAGVLHLLFHPAHIATEGVADALLAAVRAARERGLEWWTARQINDWERARRALRWRGGDADETGDRVFFTCAEPLPDATLLALAPTRARVRLDGAPVSTTAVERHGFRFLAVVADLAAGDHTLEFTRET